MLTPGDILRMKNRLKASSQEFLYAFTTVSTIEGTELPIPVLKPVDEEGGRCPLLGNDGCSIYEDRPLACRYYPVGAGLFHNADAAENERFYALVKEPHCQGHDLGTEMTIREWREDQGITEYDDINSRWIEIVLKRKSLGPFVNIPEKTLQMFFMGSYNIDSFKEFVFSTSFLDIYEIDDERIERIKRDEIALFDLAVDWLMSTFYGGGLLKIREHTADMESVEVD
jgi:Fe-S-cluster containining protein